STVEVPTRPLGEIEAAFAPLPNGALVGEERYEILDCQSEGQKLNVYQAQGLRPFLRCPNPECGFDGSEPGESFCSNCGAALDGASPSYPQFVLKESGNSAMFSAAGEVARLELSHPATIAPRDFFEVTPYGETVWEYVVPFYYKHPFIGTTNFIFRAYRYGPDFEGLKEKGNDIQEGKRSIPLVRLFQQAKNHDLQKVLKIMGKKQGTRTEKEIELILSLMKDYVIFEETRKLAQGLAEKSQEILDSLPFNKDSMRVMDSLVQFLVSRTF
ncbi:MAG: hypothetical protein ACFFAE_15060, partial [Candidatus Hodarchaeota archaeon]